MKVSHSHTPRHTRLAIRIYYKELKDVTLGLAEQGPVASVLLPRLGALYWLLELLAVYTLYYVMVRYAGLPRDHAITAAVTGPWLAGWSNLGAILRHAGCSV